MSAGARVAGFGALLVAIFALAALAGRALDPATEAAGKADHPTAAGAAARARRRPPAPAAMTRRSTAAPVTCGSSRGHDRPRCTLAAPAA